jgi:Phage integrase, N-terminal SAM-like domain
VGPRPCGNWNIFLAGSGQLSPGTQATYIDAVRKLAAYYRRSPDQLSEEEVRAYILNLRERGAARGTFKANYYVMTPVALV